MKIPFWTAWRAREREKESASQRRTDAWADRLIDDHELHQLNEEITLPGDPPYYDSCPDVGDGHGHLSPDWPFYAGWAPKENPDA